MAGRYAPIPTSTDAERELDDAFGPDDDADHHETAPLTGRRPADTDHDDYHRGEQATSALAGGYDFDREYEYDRPPPGSPPPPSSRALPNDYGNTNGEIPTAPARPAMPRPRFGILRRAMGAILPIHYAPLPQGEGPTQVIGGGLQNDGVFANVTAKPERGQLVRATNGETYVMPEDTQKDTPPSYADAQADAVPTYYETTIHAAPVDPNADVLVDELPTGSIWIFLVNVFISFFFQVVGFLLTYLLHTTHAAKFGSRAGLGLTLIQLGLYSRGIASQSVPHDPVDALFGWTMPGMNETAMANGTMYGDPSASMMPPASAEPLSDTAPDPSATDAELGSASRDWISFILMSLGWFVLLTSVVGYWRVKRWERAIRGTAQAPPPRAQRLSPEVIERDREIRRNLEAVFGIASEDEIEGDARRRAEMERRVQQDESGNVIVLPARETLEEQRLTRDLQAAGLL
ncbi:hypothetical protein HDZ31DRAFT_64056 [Schizophyllum fasciatum]